MTVQDPLHCLSSLLSPVTSLTSLDLDLQNCDHRFTAAVDLHLSRLQHLKVNSPGLQTASVLFNKLTAPLVTVHIKHKLTHPVPSRQGDMLRAQQLWASLQKLTQLTSLTIDLNLVRDDAV